MSRSELLPTGTQPVPSDPSADGLRDLIENQLDRMADGLERARSDADAWRAKAEAATLEAVRSEAQRMAAERVVDELRTELARLRLPVWKRWLGR